MHRETNFAGGERGDNRGTKCPNPKRCWMESNSAFSLVHPVLLGGASPEPSFRASAVRFVRISPASSSIPAQSCVVRFRFRVLRAFPAVERRTRPLHSAFTDRSVGKYGRQSSNKQNAVDGERFDEKCTAKRRTTAAPSFGYPSGSRKRAPRIHAYDMFTMHPLRCGRNGSPERSRRRWILRETCCRIGRTTDGVHPGNRADRRRSASAGACESTCRRVGCPGRFTGKPA